MLRGEIAHWLKIIGLPYHARAPPARSHARVCVCPCARSSAPCSSPPRRRRGRLDCSLCDVRRAASNLSARTALPMLSALYSPTNGLYTHALCCMRFTLCCGIDCVSCVCVSLHNTHDRAKCTQRESNHTFSVLLFFVMLCLCAVFQCCCCEDNTHTHTDTAVCCVCVCVPCVLCFLRVASAAAAAACGQF